ncbi:hypothetical protein CVS27_01835 [Arthrobacter glacialis]|uniref:Uncharacterized protein n=1 Tax=Arthrobacter glacialis TaxID=1664 RepID=A0A2S4A1J3_ARTGL|nr:hypothetical protein CVS27_01835 [Arthrobacter glacialis]
MSLSRDLLMKKSKLFDHSLAVCAQWKAFTMSMQKSTMFSSSQMPISLKVGVPSIGELYLQQNLNHSRLDPIYRHLQDIQGDLAQIRRFARSSNRALE